MKTNYRFFTYSHSSTNSENLVKIGPANVELIGQTGIIKNIFKIKKNRGRT